MHLLLFDLMVLCLNIKSNLEMIVVLFEGIEESKEERKKERRND